ncbi:MAG TPA: DNA polymerase IV [Myxococcaceae bacterium]|nr:DNA polymerase IV [Myxococcaceae bacterium]
MAPTIIHVDMDAFYASVEQRDNPSLRGQPVIVGGHPKRGVVLAASYEVRPFGVRSAMPMAVALRLAPHARVLPPRFAAYVEASEQVFEIFESFTPLVEPLSLDEAFLDVGASLGLFGGADRLAALIRARIANEVALPASAGIAATKFVAKIASDLAKPNGQYRVPAEETESFLAALPISRLWGVGKKTESFLLGQGIRTTGDLAAREPSWLEKRLGSGGRHLWDLSRGVDPRPVVPDRLAKSVGAEDTFDEDRRGIAELTAAIHAQSLRVGRRLRRAGLKSAVVQLKVKFSNFKLVTRRTTLEQPTDDGQQIYRTAIALLERLDPDQKIRLTGVSAQGLRRGSEQLSLFDPQPRRGDLLNAALDRIAEKFGAGAISTADLNDPHSDR